MDWKKDLGAQDSKYYEWFNIFAAFAVLGSLLTQRPLFLLFAGVIFTFVAASKMYDKRVGKKLYIRNERTSVRLFPNNEEKISIRFQNESFLPIINGELSFKLEDNVQLDNYEGVLVQGEKKYYVPLSIIGKGETELSLSVKAIKRGVARVKAIQYVFPHFINFRTIGLYYRRYYQTEIIVYPKPIPVKGLQETYFNTIGDQRTNISPYEDILNPIGTRDYTSSDPFHRIHWKASVRKQSLQTKVLEKTRDNTWIFIINISASSRLGNTYFTNNIENLLSYVTFVCHFATKMGIPFEIHLNTQRGKKLFSGQGKEHLKSALELLAKVSNQNTLVPFQHLLYKIDHQINRQQTVILFGELPDEARIYTAKWTRKGLNVFRVVEHENGATIESTSKVGDGLEHIQ
ncbi:uncharacterized protein (DUF58 family) [Salirhabdus euzebyi]|uniref:Uncharacterized protein (DUF58 family) n=1 Tax=Salirhabdus euzebyi TaxID=394506 RepID=A0A841Q526_9BACI|nr:DUF58 domain-containing protein [Salirhabdus euzebyi]MBB6453494.1 uncharacterized protein (DUF58 family) [Salirhabdus euzebyi]